MPDSVLLLHELAINPINCEAIDSYYFSHFGEEKTDMGD